MSIAIPFRSEEQRRSALREATHRRSMRAQRKALWKRDGRDEAVADLWDLLESPPEWAATWKCWDVLLAIPKMGDANASAVLNRTRISLKKTLGGLSDRQRDDLVKALRTWLSGYATHDACPSCGGRKTVHAVHCRQCAAEAMRTWRCQCGNRMKQYARQCWTCRYGHPYPGRKT